jgi:hypothetical protein
MVSKLTINGGRMNKGLLRQERVQTTKKDQYSGQSTDDEKLKVKAAPFKVSNETLYNDFVTCNYIRGYN